jgi:hypothetical protein
MTPFDTLLQLLFVLAVPLLVVAGVLAGLFGLGAVFYLLDNPEATRGLAAKIEAAFRRPPKPPKPSPPDHYYRSYWASREG